MVLEGPRNECGGEKRVLNNEKRGRSETTHTNVVKEFSLGRRRDE